MSAAQTVVIAEDNFDGHRWMYVQLLLEYAAAHGLSAHLVTVDGVPERLQEQAVSLGGEVHRLESLDLARLARFADALGAGICLIPDGDQVALSLGRGARWTGRAHLRVLVMRAHAQRSGSAPIHLMRSAARRALLMAAARRKNVDVVILCSGAKAAPRRNEAPDPIGFAPAKDSTIKLQPDVRWLGIIGAVDARKNPLMVIEAAALAGLRAGVQVGVLIAGRIAPEVAEVLPDPSNCCIPLHIENRRLEDDELDALVRDVDITVMAHSNDGPSGILAKSLAAGTKVLAAGSQVLRQDVVQTGEGAVWTELEVGAVADGVVELLAMPAPRALGVGSDAFCRRLLG